MKKDDDLEISKINLTSQDQIPQHIQQKIDSKMTLFNAQYFSCFYIIVDKMFCANFVAQT